MKTIGCLIVSLAFSFALSSAPVHAQESGAHGQTGVNWQQRDTAVYVVSTLNLVGRTKHHTVQQVFQRLNVTHVDVYADTAQAGLYFIELKRDDGSIVGSLAYQMGWPKPKRIAWSTGRSLPAVAPAIAQAYKADAKTLIGSFTSTLPA